MFSRKRNIFASVVTGREALLDEEEKVTAVICVNCLKNSFNLSLKIAPNKRPNKIFDVKDKFFSYS